VNPVRDSQVRHKVPQFLGVAAILACEKCIAYDQTAHVGKFHQSFDEDVLPLPRGNPAKQADDGRIPRLGSTPRPGWSCRRARPEIKGFKAIVNDPYAAILATGAFISFGRRLRIRHYRLRAVRQGHDQSAIYRAEMIRIHNIVEMEAKFFSQQKSEHGRYDQCFRSVRVQQLKVLR